jgi:hypothetical protein
MDFQHSFERMKNDTRPMDCARTDATRSECAPQPCCEHSTKEHDKGTDFYCKGNGWTEYQQRFMRQLKFLDHSSISNEIPQRRNNTHASFGKYRFVGPVSQLYTSCIC